jgi:hypothetical protein
MKLWSILKDARAQFPGFRQYVDSEMHRITGKDVANASIQNMISDINSFMSGKNTERDKVVSFLNREENIKVPNADWAVRQALDGKMDMSQAVGFVADYNRLRWDREADKSRREYKEFTEADTIKDIVARVNMDAPQQIIASFNQRDIMAGHTMQDFISGKAGEIKDKDATAMAFKQYEEVLRQQMINTYMQEKVPGDPAGRTWYQMAPKEIDAAVEQHLGPVRRQADLILNDKYGTASADERYVKNLNNNRLRQMYDNPAISQALSNMHNARQISPFIEEVFRAFEAGPLETGVKSYVEGSAKAASEQPGLTGIPGGPGKRPTPPSGIPFTMIDNLRDAQKHNVVDQQAYDSMVHIVEGISNPKANDTEKRNLAKYAFDPANVKLMPAIEGFKSQMSVYGRMTSPEIVNTMRKLGGEDWKNYTNFVGSSYDYMFRTHVLELNNLTDDPATRVAYDNKTHQWDVKEAITRTPGTPEMRMQAYRDQTQTAYAYRNTKEVLDRLNFGIRALVRVYKEEGIPEEEIDTRLRRNMHQMGLVEGAETPGSKMVRALEMAKAHEELQKKFKKDQF